MSSQTFIHAVSFASFKTQLKSNHDQKQKTHANRKGSTELCTTEAVGWLEIMETLCTNDLAKGGVLLRLSKHLRRRRGLRLLLLPLGLQFSLKNELPNYLHFKRSKVRQQSLASGHLAPAACSGLWNLMQLHSYRQAIFTCMPLLRSSDAFALST